MHALRNLLIAVSVVVGIASAALLATGTPAGMLLAGLRELFKLALEARCE